MLYKKELKQIVKCNLILVLFCGFFLSSEAQVNMIIKNLYLDDIYIKIDKNIYIEGELVSPRVKGELIIKNNTDDTVSLSLNEDCFTLLFNYEKKPFANSIDISFNKGIKKKLLPCDSLFINFKCDLVRYTRLQKRQEDIYDTDYVIDYSKEMLEILPTIRILYIDSKQVFWSTQIENVSVNYPKD